MYQPLIIIVPNIKVWVIMVDCSTTDETKADPHAWKCVLAMPIDI